MVEIAQKIPFDDRVNHNAKLDDLNKSLIYEFLNEINSKLFEEKDNLSFLDLCKKMKIVKGPEENLKPINAALLMFNKNPEKFFPGTKIEIVIHRGNVGRNFTEKIFSGPINKQLENSIEYIKNNIIHEEVRKVQGKAKSTRFVNYPFEAIEEVLANAVYHKGYNLQNPIEVQIDNKAIQVLSFPGPLPPVDNKMLNQRRVIARNYRNRRIGDFLKELDLTEGRSTGFPLIYQSLEENGSPPPIFKTDEKRTYFLAKIKIFPYMPSQKVLNGKINGRINGTIKISDSLQNTLNIISNNPGIKAGAISQKSSKSLSTVKKHIMKLKQKGLIIRKGSKKTGGYYSKDYSEMKSGNINGTINGTITLSQALEKTLKIISNNPGIKAKEVSSKSAKSASTVKKHIMKLKQKGLIIRKGSKKNGGYYTRIE